MTSRLLLKLASVAIMLWLPSAYGQFVVPADVSVQMSAAPSTGLITGQPFVVTLTATNHGPAPVDLLLLTSTAFRDEFDSSVATNDCTDLGVVVYDGKSYYYKFWWFPTTEGVLEVGVTRTCHITLGLSSLAPDILEFGFEVNQSFEDLDPSNNSASVTLRRASATPLPALSVPGLLVVLVGLAVAGGLAARRRQSPDAKAGRVVVDP
jgi:hypothetical protein